MCHVNDKAVICCPSRTEIKGYAHEHTVRHMNDMHTELTQTTGAK